MAKLSTANRVEKKHGTDQTVIHASANSFSRLVNADDA